MKLVNTSDLIVLRKDFLQQNQLDSSQLHFEGHVGSFYLTTTIYHIIKGWVDEALQISEHKKGLITSRIKSYGKNVDIDSPFAEESNNSRFRREFDKSLQPESDYYLTGYKHFLIGKNKGVQTFCDDVLPDLRENVDLKNFPRWCITEVDYELKHFTESEYFKQLQLNCLFSYCNGYAMAKFVTFMEDGGYNEAVNNSNPSVQKQNANITTTSRGGNSSKKDYTKGFDYIFPLDPTRAENLRHQLKDLCITSAVGDQELSAFIDSAMENNALPVVSNKTPYLIVLYFELKKQVSDSIRYRSDKVSYKKFKAKVDKYYKP